MNTRDKTRRERYNEKKSNSKTYPISLCCINFMHDGNLGYLIRSAACFGAETIHVIGSVPDRSELNPSSGSLYDYVKIERHPSPRAFLDYAEDKEFKIISAEICEGATPLSAYHFRFDGHIVLVVGNEETGIPAEILKK